MFISEIEEGDGGCRELLNKMAKRNTRGAVYNALLGGKSCYSGKKPSAVTL